MGRTEFLDLADEKRKDTDKSGDDNVVSRAMMEAAKLAGQAGGATIGFVLGGPGGAAMGAIASGVVQISADTLNRRISKRQETRIGMLLNAAKDTLSARVMNGAKRREDNFFNGEEGHYSHYEEMLEDLLRAVTDTIEERKIPYMANMFANFILSDAYQVYKMRDIIRHVEDLSFLQLKLLAIIVDESQLQADKIIWIGNRSFERRALDLSLEKRRLQSLGVTDAQNVNEFDENNCGPSPLPSTLGQEIYDLMELSRLPIDEITELKSELYELGLCQ